MYPKKNNPLHALVLLTGLWLPLWSPASLAERADSDKPMHLEADQMLVDDARQTSTFTGNVRFTQGTLQISGDKIVVVQDKEGYKHGIAYGNTASFRQKREGLDEYVEGHGERIEYDMRAETVNFYVRASVRRALDEVRGEHITYNAKTEIFHVNSGAQPPGDAPPKRVRAILQPKPKQTEAVPADALPIKPSTILIPVEQR